MMEKGSKTDSTLEMSLREVLFQILQLVNEKKDHIPPVSNSNIVSFPYEITIPRFVNFSKWLKMIDGCSVSKHIALMLCGKSGPFQIFAKRNWRNFCISTYMFLFLLSQWFVFLWCNFEEICWKQEPSLCICESLRFFDVNITYAKTQSAIWFC